ncbi:TetR family transcriptional regulator [Actinocorallia herbida]|uniref:TetR family transcriptional regulator n=1 Tax=Actinocorallia herbida TaxID=58109 RepID=A0A3N1CW13_9ACTN|nr:TetR/AcrR family transcriptional regulator [Actinocorallia herbida]ROO85502.1 TetR family transcriptional regulator [Actinocorallia herbida]
MTNSRPAPSASPAASGAGLPAFKRERRTRILEAALGALQGQEFEQIRIAEVAQGADVALGTLYRYFPSKELLYAVALREWVHRQRLDAAMPGRTPEERIRARLRGVIGAFEAQPQFFKTHLLLYGSGDPEVEAILGEVSALAEEVLTGDFAALSVAEPRDDATMLWSILHSLLSSAIYQGGAFGEVYRLVDDFITLVLETRDGPVSGSPAKPGPQEPATGPNEHGR